MIRDPYNAKTFGALVALLVGMAAWLLPFGAVTVAEAGDRTTFRGCVVERTDSAITLATSADERVSVDTTWISPNALDSVLVDCVTVTALTVDGRFVAESIEAGDEPNEVNSVTNETTADRETRAKQRQDRDDKGQKKQD
jgi:hypothetical protein